MITTLSPEYIKMAAQRTERIKEDISAYRFAGIEDEQIKELIIRRYGLSDTYAQNFLDDDSKPEESTPEAV